MLKIISALLGKAKDLIPALQAAFRWDFLEVIVRSWPLIFDLVKELDNDYDTPGADKAAIVRDKTLALLGSVGFHINPAYDWILDFVISLALFLIRVRATPEGAPVKKQTTALPVNRR